VHEVEALCGISAVARRERGAGVVSKRRAAPSLWRTLLRLMIDAPQLAQAVTPDQRALLATQPEFAPVVALVDHVHTTGVTRAGALLEAARGSPFAALYAEIACDNLSGTTQYEEARADFEGVLAKLELSVIETQYRELCGKPSMSTDERTQLHAVSRRLAELKGGRGVAVVPPR
jgi:hypothetical protein